METQWAEPNVMPEWLKQVPLKLRNKLLWHKSKSVEIPKRAIVLLYVGPENEESLDNLIIKQKKDLKDRIVVVEKERCHKTQDALKEEPYYSLCTAAMEGKIAQIGGGPNCRTWSIRRHFPRPGGGKPLRGLEGM